MVRSVLIALAALALLPAAARARITAFKSPTGNIRCVISDESGSFAQCGLYSKRRLYFVGTHGKAKSFGLETHDDLARLRKVLHYGRSKSFGRYTCTSHKSHMTCRNRHTKHGFTLSRQHQRRF